MNQLRDLRDEYKLGLIGNYIEKVNRVNKIKRKKLLSDKLIQFNVQEQFMVRAKLNRPANHQDD